jgi:hypothetical protein
MKSVPPKTVGFQSNTIYLQIIHIWPGYGLADPGFESWQGPDFHLFSKTFSLSLGPAQPRIQWVTGVLSPQVQRPRREADNCLHLALRLGMSGAKPPLPLHAFLACTRKTFRFYAFIWIPCGKSTRKHGIDRKYWSLAYVNTFVF